MFSLFLTALTSHSLISEKVPSLRGEHAEMEAENMVKEFLKEDEQFSGISGRKCDNYSSKQ